MISDLRYVDPATPSGGWQARDILLNAGTPPPVIDWVLELVRDKSEECQALERELYQVHMDRNQ
jgi:hypothetical protein